MAEVDELARIADVLDGTNPSGPLGAGLAKYDDMITQLTAAVAAITAGNAHLDTMKTDLAAIKTEITAIKTLISTSNTHLAAIKTSIDNVDVAVDLALGDLTITDTPRVPQTEPNAIRKSVTAASGAARSPKTPLR